MPSKDVPIGKPTTSSATFVAPTPQNTPMVSAPIAHIAHPTIPTTITEVEAETGVDLEGIQSALHGLEEDDGQSADIQDLPYSIRRRVEGLKGVHVDYIKLESQYKKELLDLDRKYAKLYAPVFERRRAIVVGEAEPTEQDIAAGEEQTLKDDPDAEPLSAVKEEEKDTEGKAEKGIPQFWLAALRNHVDISELITDRDEEALESLIDIKLEYLSDPTPGYKLTFYFAPNDFFTNEVLTKTYHYQDEVDYFGDYVYSSAEGCTLNWKEDHDLTKTFEVRKQRNKNTNRTRIVKRALSTPSFFDFFSPPTPPDPESVESNDLTEEQLEELQDKLEIDYQMGEDLKDKIIPRAIDYFTGKALEYEGESVDDDEFEEGAEEGEWDDDDSVESEEESPVKARRQVTKGGGKTDTGECKNQ